MGGGTDKEAGAVPVPACTALCSTSRPRSLAFAPSAGGSQGLISAEARLLKSTSLALLAGVWSRTLDEDSPHTPFSFFPPSPLAPVCGLQSREDKAEECQEV